ncbi:MAG: phospholipase D-like domain-containing protein [Leptotrichiaceae bacterium]|nr:phospholipase D-like domain-containing protein [Leptotrichiaceae bacterium]
MKFKNNLKYRNIRKYLFSIYAFLAVSCSTIKTPPPGVNYESPLRKSQNVDFHYDLTYLDKDGNIKYDRNLWEATYKIIDNAEDYLIIEMFLFNDIYNKDKEKFPEFAKEYIKRLIKKQTENPELKIYILTDENNNLYGAFEHPFLTEMKRNGINVIIVDIFKLKDTFPWYSPIWRSAVKPFGNPQNKGWITNFYGPMWPKLTLRNLLRALNVKADHKKVFLNEREVVVSSANIHDPSYFHENIAVYADGDITGDVLNNLKLVAEFSDSEINVESKSKENNSDFSSPEFKAMDNTVKVSEKNTENNEITDTEGKSYEIQYISEGIIGKYMDSDIDSLQSGDELIMGMYFLADKNVVNKLIKAANRGVKIRLILDRSRDAFGMSTNGLPNKPVSKKLKKKTGGKIEIKWYFTNNEQYHTKITLMKKTDGSVIISAGSANLIKKNIRGYIMDANFRILTDENSKLTKDIYAYFDRLWDNKDGIFTINFEDEPTTSGFSDFMYKILDATQLGSF